MRTDRLSLFQSARNPARTETQLDGWQHTQRRDEPSGRAAACSACLGEGGVRDTSVLMLARADLAVEMMFAVRASAVVDW